MRGVALVLVRARGCCEQLRIDLRWIEHDLAVVRRTNPRAGHDEVARSLDVHDEMIRRDLADRTDLFAALFEIQLIANGDMERHACTLPPAGAGGTPKNYDRRRRRRSTSASTPSAAPRLPAPSARASQQPPPSPSSSSLSSGPQSAASAFAVGNGVPTIPLIA